jgi:hypothetical protein
MENIKYTALWATMFVCKSNLEYIKLQGFFEQKKVAQYQFIVWKTIRFQNELFAKFWFTLEHFMVEPNFLKGKTLYFELLFSKTLFFIQNKHLNITSAINPPLMTIFP